MLAQVGVTTYAVHPIQIISQETTTVSYSIHQEWVAGSALSPVCSVLHIRNWRYIFDNQDFTKSQTLTYTAHYMHSVHKSIVDIWVADASLKSDDNAEVPVCCHPMIMRRSPFAATLLRVLPLVR